MSKASEGEGVRKLQYFLGRPNPLTPTLSPLGRGSAQRERIRIPLAARHHILRNPIGDEINPGLAVVDLAVFGTNAIELIPPRSDDDADSPHFPLPPLEMMTKMSQLAADYGLDVWIWYPAMDRDYTKPETVAFALKEWEEVYKKLPRIDAGSKSVELRASELAMMLDGIDLRSIRRVKRYQHGFDKLTAGKK